MQLAFLKEIADCEALASAASLVREPSRLTVWRHLRRATAPLEIQATHEDFRSCAARAFGACPHHQRLAACFLRCAVTCSSFCRRILRRVSRHPKRR